MKAAVISDVHLHLFNYGDAFARLQNQTEALNWALEQASEEQVDVVFFTGDLFHTPGRINTVVLSSAYSVFRKFAHLQYVFVPGNHDQATRSNEQSALCFLEQFGHVVGPEKSRFSLPNLPEIRALPYTEDHDALRFFLEQCPAGSIVLTHQGVRGVEVNSKGFTLNEGIDPPWIPGSVLHLFTGHYHSMKDFLPNATIPGALMQHNFGDVGDARGFLLVSGEKELQMSHRHSNAWKFHSLVYEDSIPWMLAEGESTAAGGFLRVTNVPSEIVSELQQELTKLGCFRADPVVIPEVRDGQVVKAQVERHEDMSVTLDRFIEANKIDALVANVGREILKEARG